jgi:homocysteine S-methyltransferase
MSSESFLEALSDRVVLFDGAFGTQLYARGVFINRSYDEQNVVNPDVVRDVHSEYLKAGADVITTNTFGANRLRLAPFGLVERLEEINVAGVTLAREIARDRAWVAGSIGPLGAELAPVGKVSPGEAFTIFKEQALILDTAGVDLFVLETFSRIEELWQAFRAVRGVSKKPIVACVSFNLSGMSEKKQYEGPTPADVARTLTQWGADVIGTNCANGPRATLEVVEQMAAVTQVPLAALPNAGLPQYIDGRTIYLAGPEYMAEYARRFVQKGARVVGGCCGTTPDCIKQMRVFLKSISPTSRGPVVPIDSPQAEAKEVLEPVPIVERSEFAKRLYGGKFCVSVELDPPRGLSPQRAIEGAEMLYKNGIDLVNIADGPRAVARMGPMALAQLVRQRVEMDALIHYCCRDRNILGMQMDLLGAHALGLHNVLAVTGDPPKMGSYPDATAVFDIDSIGLLSFIQMLNRGMDFSGSQIGGQTAFFVGAGCNPGHIDVDMEADRFGRKISAGAEFFFSQPVYEPELLDRFFDLTKDFPRVPFMVGILPLVSAKNAEFLHNEVPGMQIPQSVRDKIGKAATKQGQREVGVSIAQETLRQLKDHPRVDGVYIFPPFGSYKAVLRVLEVL